MITEENENEQRHEQREIDVPENHQSEKTSQRDDFAFREIEKLWERSLEKFHECYDTCVEYAYFKEKIIGKTGKKGKKNNFYWLETNDIYIERIQRAVKIDRDYWISAAEVSERITDKEGKPVLREKWISQIRCHFLVLDLNEASEAENLGLDFTLWEKHITELVLEHCRQRGLPEPIIWGDCEEVVILWPLIVPYYKAGPEINHFTGYTGEIFEDSFAFNYKWNEVQNLLYEDLKYLGANPKRKHAVTMLRVPGTFNTHANAPVRLLHDAERTTIEELNKGLNYVREALKNGQTIERPNLQAKLQEIKDEYDRFLEFSDALDATNADVEETASKSKSKKSKAKSTTSKPKEAKRAQKGKKSKASSKVKPEKVSKPKVRESLPEKSGDLTVPPERQGEYEKFLEQINQDVLQIHPANDSYITIRRGENYSQVFQKYVCLCLKKESEAWRQMFVTPRELEKKLTELWLKPDFSTHHVYISQASFLSNNSRKVEDVASLSVSFLDIDGKFAREHKDLTPEEWADLIIEECRAKAIPLPNIIVFSGNGIHVKWLYKTAITREKLKRWERLQKKLWKLFEDFGADPQSKDAARVLRVPGTKNCKPETVDRDVRVVKFNPERCEFEELEARLNELLPNDENNLQDAPERIAIPEVEAPASQNAPCFCVKNETTGVTEFVKAQEMSEYLSRQDKTHVLRRSIAEFWKPELNAVRRIYCNYAVLSSEKVPGENLEEQAANIRKHCAEYWNGLGFQEPNGIMSFKGKLIVVWKYVLSDYLPRKALPRWKRTQEYICYHFADWGAMDEAEYQEVTALLPIAEITGNTSEMITSAARYKFDDLARQILRYTQKEVKEYKKKQAEEKAKAKEDFKTLTKTKRKSKTKKGHTEAFDGMAGRRFADILRLIELRKDKRGEVPEGHRELSVFWGMNFAAQAGIVSDQKDFDALTQKLIDENGLQFRSESDIRQFNSLRERFIRQDRELYKALTGTLIDQLGIQPSEQEELEVLREFPKKEKKTNEPKTPSLESLKLWELEGISRRTWYRRRKAEREALKKEEAERQYSLTGHEIFIAKVIERIVRIVYTTRTIDTARLYYEGGCGDMGGVIRVFRGGGSGNFLTEPYLSLRRLENKIIKLLAESSYTPPKNESLIKVSISQFYGIEINDFAVAVARTALWIAESQMWNETQRMNEEQRLIPFLGDLLPLKTYNQIVEDNALRTDWKTLVPSSNNLYIMGNPPFLGYSIQSREQKQDMQSVFLDETGKPYSTAGKIDYVAGWYHKASEIIAGTGIKAAFVSTNSITQGEQVTYIFKTLHDRFGIEIDFAHQTFVWNSEATDQAHVHVVVIGFDTVKEAGRLRRLYTPEGLKLVENINFYLVAAPNDFAESTSKAVSESAPAIMGGNRPADGGNLVIEAEDYEDFIRREPGALKYIKRYMMGREFINNLPRYCLWLVGISLKELRSMPLVLERVKACKEDRLEGAADRRKLADTPHLFRETQKPKRYIAIPVVSSEEREYIPIGWLDASVIPGNKLFIIPDATLYDFGILTSLVHMAWMRRVGGRMKSDYSYSKNIVYDTFVWPHPTEEQRKRIEATAQSILDARVNHPESSFADLYDDTVMPSALRQAHRENDAAVCVAYGWPEDISEEAIVQRLFGLYHELTA